MGERGPAGYAKKTLKLHGTFREDRHGDGDLPPSEPSCPSWLSKEAKAEWKRITPTLVEMVGVHKIDRSLLALYCETWAEYHRSCAILKKEGEIYEAATKSGFIKMKHPMVAIRQAARNDLVKIGRQLGLSPSARTGLNIGTPDKNEQMKGKFLA